MSKAPFNIKKYWNDRLSSNLNLKGTGHRAFSLKYNQYLYHAQVNCLSKLLEKRNIDLHNKSVLDVGSGTGYFIDFYLKHDPRKVCGIDISEISVNYLKTKFPNGNFLVEDISNTTVDYLGKFDFIAAISVLYHVVEDTSFQQALKNLCSLCEPEGYLLISDAFKGSQHLSARHAHLRTLDEYSPFLNDFEIVEIAPIYYYLNRGYIPYVGPWLIDKLNLGSVFYRLDEKMRAQERDNGNGMKFLLARRRS